MNRIGKVVKVTYDKLIFEVSDFNSLDFNYSGVTYITKGVIDYVTIIDKTSQKYIYQIIEVEDREIPILADENSKFDYIGRFICSPIGLLRNGRIEFNLETYPFLQDEVFLTSDEEYELIFDNSKLQGINLGTIRSKFNAIIDLDKLFTNHTAILGNTGSGKSTTIRQILNETKKLNTSNLHIHIFDVHDEYPCEDEKSQITNVLSEYKIPMMNLDLQDWINLVKPSDLVQLPIMQNSLKIAHAINNSIINRVWLKCYIAYTMYTNVQTDAVAKRTKIINVLVGTGIPIDKYDSKYANFSNADESVFLANLLEKMDQIVQTTDKGQFLQNQLKESKYTVDSFENLLEGLEFTFLLEECKGNSQARSHSGTMETRIKSLETRYGSMLVSMHDVENKKSKTVNIYSVTDLDDDLLLFFTSFFIKEKFEINRKRKLIDREVNIFVLEEAHRYLSKNSEKSVFNESELFKKIAREGRKFGCFLFLSSQRPSELSTTVLSQCNNYLIHRIKNTLDLDQMLSSIPYIAKNQLSRITFLPTGTVYIVGDLLPIPLEVAVFDELTQDVSSAPNIKFNSNVK